MTRPQIAVLVVGLLLVPALQGCPKPPPVVTGPADLADLSAVPAPQADLAPPELVACPPRIELLPEDTCESLVTDDGLQCVACRGAGGCVFEAAMIYCAAGGCLRDPRCKADPGFRPALRRGAKGARHGQQAGN